MAQHDMNIANQGFPAFRADLNSALTAIANNSSGATAPSTTFAYQWWYDTSTNALKMRNADNDAWIEIGTFNQATDSFTPSGVTSDSISEGNSSVEVVDTGTGYVAVAVDGVETARFLAGYVGIGITNPSKQLHLYDDTESTVWTQTASGFALHRATTSSGDFYFGIDNSSGAGFGQGNNTRLIYSTGSYPITLSTNSTERMRIASNGNVGIGTTSPAYKLAVKQSDEFQGLSIINAYNSNEWGLLVDGSNSLRFSYNAGGVNAGEKMRIDSSGSLLVNTISSSGSARLDVHGLTSSYTSNFRVGLNGNLAINFQNQSGNQVGYVQVGSTSTAYSTASDYRLKEDWQPMVSTWDRVKSLKPVNFAWISTGERVDGFLAHELQEVIPEAVTGEKDAMRTEEYEVSPAVYEDVVIPAEYDEEGNLIAEEYTTQELVSEAVMGTREVPDYQGIDQSKLVPLLTAALQDAIAKIEALEARVDALENA